MKISIITPCYNAASFIEEGIQSILDQRQQGAELELIVVDGGSRDGTVEILQGFGDQIDVLISEPDQGPADAINKGFALATGEVVAWLNADDCYLPNCLKRVGEAFEAHPEAVFVFGHCPIVNEAGDEIRSGITRFKECFYPFSCRFTFQCINYLSQPASFYRKSAIDVAGPLRLDLKAAWDYEFFLRLWRQGKGIRISKPALAQFCWHPGSISGQHFRRQFQEEFDCAREDTGPWRIQTLIHFFVKWGIVGMYTLMTRKHRT
ncbi:glycosyltransferase family 2 protein [Kiritimatiellota bacterium B12222]|nr:glycosyltransferase family 2 protein [Kiritimatiellota bacterium B12222]